MLKSIYLNARVDLKLLTSVLFEYCNINIYDTSIYTQNICIYKKNNNAFEYFVNLLLQTKKKRF